MLELFIALVIIFFLYALVKGSKGNTKANKQIDVYKEKLNQIAKGTTSMNAEAEVNSNDDVLENHISEHSSELISIQGKGQDKFERKFNYAEFATLSIERTGVQVLETLNIMLYTKNLDTLISRYEFLTSIYKGLVESSDSPRFYSMMQNSIDMFKNMFYNTQITDVSMSLLLKPNFEILSSVYGECIVNTYNRYYEQQIVNYNNLKRKDARVRRLNDLISKVDIALEELTSKCTESKDYHVNYNSLTQTKSELKQKLEMQVNE
jgi:hypothetical protein